MQLLAKGSRPFRFGPALGWAISWGVGAALGIAAGAWLTVVGEAGAPGIESIDPSSELITLPLAGLAIVAVLHLTGQLIAAVWRGMRARRAALGTDEDGGHAA